VWTPHRGDVAGPAVGAEGRDARTALIGMGLGGLPQSRHQTASAGGHHLFCACTPLERPARDRHPTGPGPRRHRVGPTVCSPRRLGRLSRVCDPRGLDDAARAPAWSGAPGVVTRVAAPTPSHPPRLDGTGADRSGPRGPLAVSAHGPPGLASVAADQPRRQGPARRPRAFPLP
jgi:hypothetical protein